MPRYEYLTSTWIGPAKHVIDGGGEMGTSEKSRIADLPLAGFMDIFKDPQATSRADTKRCRDADDEASNTMSSA
jgi:hypothetical protein